MHILEPKPVKRLPNGTKRQNGIAIVTVITITTVLAILVITLSFVAVSETRSARNSVTFDTTTQIADAISERARLTLINALSNSNYTAVNFLKRLQQNQPILLRDGTSVTLANTTHSVVIDGVSGRWKLGNISSIGDGWVDIAATAETPKGVQTVMRRVSFGSNSIFNLAILTETVNCMFCHLKVNGDVGAIQHLRRGWGFEGVDGHGSGGWYGLSASKITGNVYAARTITADSTNLSGSPKTINGAEVTGTIEANSTNDALPEDNNGDGIADFPPIKREVAQDNSNGSLTIPAGASDGARMFLVPNGSTLSSIPTSSTGSSISGTYNGSVVLIGTAANPINLDEDIFVTGDVVIKGYITGRGAIYAGRNMYIAGDIITKNPPDKLNAGVCAGITNPDQCAKKNIEANKDEFRAGARNNIIMGDYTEKNASNADMPWFRKQAADFYRSQFGFWGGTRYYQKGNGDELDRTCVGSTCTYKNIEGTVIPSAQVQASPSGQDYTYSFRPGSMSSTGAFTNWLSDGLYQTILGTKALTYGTWRYDVGSATSTTIKNQLQSALAGHTISTNLSYNLTKAATKCDGCTRTIRNSANQDIAKVYWSGNTMKVMVMASATYDKQVNRVDAYLYANQRVAGKVFSEATAINGGIAAQEIGILAPGRVAGWPWDSYNAAVVETCDGDGVGDTNVVAGADDCGFTVNYDYRLRNGGYGYKQINGVVGKTIGWSVADEIGERVQ